MIQGLTMFYVSMHGFVMTNCVMSLNIAYHGVCVCVCMCVFIIINCMKVPVKAICIYGTVVAQWSEYKQQLAQVRVPGINSQ